MNLDFRFYLSIFFRRFHYFLLVAAIISASGIAVAMMLPATYRASALLLVERPQIPDELAASTVQTNTAQQVQIIEQQLTSRASVLEIADKMNIYPNRRELSPDAIISDMRQRIRIVTPRATGRSAPTMTVSFEAPDPRLAAAVANELVTQLLEKNVALRTGSATQTLEFFEQEVARLEDEIQTRSNRILQFKLENQDALPESLEFRRAQQASALERLRQTERELAALRERRTKLVELFETTGRVDVAAANLTPEQRQLQQLERELENALLVYSEANPRVKILQAKISNLETVVAQQSGNVDEDAPSLFEIQLADIDSQAEILERQKQDATDTLADLQQSIDQTPRNAIQLGELNRALQTSQQQFSETMRNLSTAQMGERIEVLSKGQRLSVIEAATVPPRPASPNRPLIAAASVGAGFFAGLAFVVLLELLQSSIRRPVEIKNKLGITPLETLPYVRTRKQTVVHRSILIALIVMVAVGGPAVIWALHTFYLPLDLLIERVIDKSGIGGLIGLLTGAPG